MTAEEAKKLSDAAKNRSRVEPYFGSIKAAAERGEQCVLFGPLGLEEREAFKSLGYRVTHASNGTTISW